MSNVNGISNGMWRTDTKALIGGVVMGVAFLIVQQVAHRIDGLLWPTLIIIGGITWATFTGLITLIFKQPAGIIMGEIQAVVALTTGLSPLALFFVPANGLASVAYSLVARFFSMEKWFHHFLAQCASNIAGNICVGFGLSMVFHLPLPIILISSSITAAAGIVGSTVLTKILYDSLKKSGMLV